MSKSAGDARRAHGGGGRAVVTFNATFNVAGTDDPEAFADHVSRVLRQRFQ